MFPYFLVQTILIFNCKKQEFLDEFLEELYEHVDCVYGDLCVGFNACFLILLSLEIVMKQAFQDLVESLDQGRDSHLQPTAPTAWRPRRTAATESIRQA